MSSAIGIDLGTTYSCVAVRRVNGVVEVIENDLGNRTTPSVVAFTASQRLVGEFAKRSFNNARNTVNDVKRLMGKPFQDSSVQDDMPLWPFKVVCGRNDRAVVEVEFKGETRQFHPEEISAAILGKLKHMAEERLGHPVKEAVITVPAYFSDAQRKATVDAGRIAGLKVLQVLNEPTAAGLAYGLDQDPDGVNSTTRKVMVFDWGGGTLDVSLMRIQGGEFHVLAVSGDSHLGGTDFDRCLARHFLEKFKSTCGLDASGNPKAVKRLMAAAEQAKKELSSSLQTRVEEVALLGCDDLECSVTRGLFEKLTKDIYPQAINLVEACLRDAGLSKDEIDEVILVGGTSRIPKVASSLKDFFGGKEPCKRINPDEAIARGAAIMASVLSNDQNLPAPKVKLHDVTPLSLGVMVQGWKMDIIVPRNTRLPCRKRSSYRTAWEGQSAADFVIFEGEHVQTAENIKLGSLRMKDLAHVRGGLVTFECTFTIAKDGLLTMEVEDEVKGETREIRIQSGRLSEDEVARMTADARANDEEEERAAQAARARGMLQDCINLMEAQLRIQGTSMGSREARSRLASIRGEMGASSHNWTAAHFLERLVSLQEAFASV